MSGHPPATPIELSSDALEFVTERHLATLTTLRPDGTPHVVPVGFTYDADAGVVRVITFAGAAKASNAMPRNGDGVRAAVCQVDGGRWITFEGIATVSTDAGDVARAVAAYAARYRQPKERSDRVVIEIGVDRVLCNARMKP